MLTPTDLLANLITGDDPRDLPPDKWPAVLAAATREQLSLPLLATLHRAEYAPPNDAWAADVKRKSGMTALFEAVLPQLEDALSPLPTIWLKGLALAHTVYDDPANRAMVDLDVLVPYEQRNTALKKLQSIGYNFNEDKAALFAPDDPIRQKLSYNYDLIGGPAGVVRVELHFRLVSADDALLPLEEMAWFLEHTMPFEVHGRVYQTLDPAAHLLYLCAHAALQHGDTATLRNFYDIHLMIGRVPIDWDMVVAQAAVLRWTYAVEQTLRRCEQTFGTVLPEGLIEQLQAARPADEDVERVLHMETRGQDWFRFRGWLRLLSWRDRLRLLWHAVFPPAGYMRERYGLTSDERLIKWYWHRWSEQWKDVWDDIRKG